MMSAKNQIETTTTTTSNIGSAPTTGNEGDNLGDQDIEAIISTNAASGYEDPEFQEFVTKYGEIDVSFIEPPRHNPWWTRPYALNYFHNGRLYRTKHERTSGRLELFMDLVYVGIVANLASSAVEEHTGASLGKYILVFSAAWTIWSDCKDIMNYYFTDDLLQRVFFIWLLIWLVVYDNNCLFVDDLEDITPLVTSVVAYFVARVSCCLLAVYYSFYIHEHRFQLRAFPALVIVSSSCWFFILLIKTNWGRAVFAAILFFLEQASFCFVFHPWVKKNIFKLEYSTALNLEHEDERYNAFFIIALGEFLYSIVADSPLGVGWNTKLAKGLSVLVVAFMFMGLYASKDGSFKATHAMRRSANTAMIYILGHFPVIASLLIVGDAGGDLTKYTDKYLPEDEFGVLMYYHGGILVALLALTVLAWADEDRTPPGILRVPKWLRIGFRIPVGCLILGLSWAYEHLTLVKIMWLDALFMVLLMIYEFTVMNPYHYFEENIVTSANH